MTIAARVGLVLGAGGITGGAFHAGVLAALADVVGWEGRAADVVVGTSAGAAMAAAVRAGLAGADVLARAEGRPLSPDGRRILAGAVPAQAPRLRPTRLPEPRVANLGALGAALRRPFSARPSAVAAALLPAGTVPTDAITEGADALHPAGWPDRAMWICAVRLSDGRRVVFGRDGSPPASVGEAVAASCAIPAWFQPVEIGSARYVDGGVHSPTNADVVEGLGLDLVVVSSPMSAASRGRLAIDTPLRQWSRVHLGAEARRLRRRGTDVIALQPAASDRAAAGLDPMDASRRAAVARAAYESTARRLERADLAPRLAALRPR